MEEDSENYDFEEAAEAAKESAQYFDRITSYSREEAMMENREELLMDAVGAIGAFANSMEEVENQSEYMGQGDYQDFELRDSIMRAGVAWPDAMKAYNAIDEVSDEISEQMTAAAFQGDEVFESAAETVDELHEAQQQYKDAMATAVASSKTLAPEGYQTPIDIALDVSDDSEVVSELQELEDEVPRTQEESDRQLMEMIEGLN